MFIEFEFYIDPYLYYEEELKLQKVYSFDKFDKETIDRLIKKVPKKKEIINLFQIIRIEENNSLPGLKMTSIYTTAPTFHNCPYMVGTIDEITIKINQHFIDFWKTFSPVIGMLKETY